MASRNFPGQMTTFESMISRWKRFPSGVIGVFDADGQLLGFLTLWPIHKQPYRQFRSGRRPEEGLQGPQINSGRTRPQRYWHIGCLVVRKENRGGFVLDELLSGAATVFSALPNIAGRLTFSASLDSPSVLGILTHYGFHEMAPNPGFAAAKLRLYEMETTRSAISGRLARARSAMPQIASRHLHVRLTMGSINYNAPVTVNGSIVNVSGNYYDLKNASTKELLAMLPALTFAVGHGEGSAPSLILADKQLKQQDVKLSDLAEALKPIEAPARADPGFAERLRSTASELSVQAGGSLLATAILELLKRL